MSLLTFAKHPIKGFRPVGVHFILNHAARLSSGSFDSIEDDDAGEFRQFVIRPSRNLDRTSKKKSTVHMVMPKDYKRSNKIDPNLQNWQNVWPGPRSFDPNAIPIPVRQGRLKMKQPTFSKYANPELMKIPNFFHLTPPAIKAQCEELKKFCTAFPEELDTKEKCDKHFPVSVITNDYLHSAPTIRDPLARIVTIKFKLKDIPFDEHARDKFRRLIKDRYNDKTDTVTIVTDRCPLRKQNYDYAQYLLTALFFESWAVEDWESEKVEADMEKYVWERNISSKALASILKWTPDQLGKSICHDPLPNDELQPEHQAYGAAVKQVVEGESKESLEQYKKAALQILMQRRSKAIAV